MPDTIALSLISHTNVGKTTLARTLLRRDVGEVLDVVHVTDVSEAHTLVEDDDDARLVLWDTPGFGDTVRLVRRLRQEGSSVGWLLHHAWDRFADRPLWCSQQAVKNVREDADVVLYLVNAAEHPDEAGYVDLEMEILQWIDRPVVVLLNQTGAPRPAEEASAEEERWRAHLARFPVVRALLALDAFSRCWIQEGALLARVGEILPAERRPLMERLLAVWRRQSLEVLDRALGLLAAALARAATDREALVPGFVPNSAQHEALGKLIERLGRDVHRVTAELIELHGLEGRAAADLEAQLSDASETALPVSAWQATLLGGVVSGALGGLAADVVSGGLTFGGGFVAGALLGAAGSAGLVGATRILQGEREPELHWSDPYLDRLAVQLVLRYLSVAHFGRGAGDYRDPARPAFWKELAEPAWARAREAAGVDYGQARDGAPEAVEAALRDALRTTVRAVLEASYPEGTRAAWPA